MDNRDFSYRSGNPASRPPASDSGDDTPLFNEIPYTSRRSSGSGGRGETPASGGRGSEWTSPYGGRPYSRPRMEARPRDPAPQERRAAPVYTELSWEDLRRGNTAGGQTAPPVSPTQSVPPQQTENAAAQRRSATPYFGGFEQERDSLFNSNQPYHTPGSENVPRREIRYVAPTRPGARQRAARERASQRTAAPEQPTPAVQPRTSRQNAAPRRTPSASAGRPSNNRPRGGKHIPPIYLMGGFVLLALLIFGIAKLAGGSGSNNIRPATPVPAVSAAPFDVQPTEVPVTAETTPEVEPDFTPTPSPEPSPTPSGPKAQKLGELIVPADWGPTVPERRREVYDSYFDKSCMIGNSLVDGFFMWSGLTNIRYIYSTGATVAGAIGGLDLAPLTLNPDGYYTDIYLMFGLNEIGIDVNSFVQSYKKLVDFIREHQSTANIYIISVTPVTKRVDEDPNEPQKMERIRTFNSALKEFCTDQNCWYLDIYSMLLDKDGYLSMDYAFVEDGKHFEKSGYVAWANYMKNHYVDSTLLTE